MSEKYTLERVYQVFDNANGAKISVKPDVDGLGLIEVDGGQDYGRIVFDPELAGIVAHAILHCCDDIAHFQKKVKAKIAGVADEAVKEEAPIADAEGWIRYKGKGNPATPDSYVDIKLQNESIQMHGKSKYWDWDIEGGPTDIAFWRYS